MRKRVGPRLQHPPLHYTTLEEKPSLNLSHILNRTLSRSTKDGNAQSTGAAGTSSVMSRPPQNPRDDQAHLTQRHAPAQARGEARAEGLAGG